MEKNPLALQSQGWALTSSCRQGANPTSFLPFQEWKSSKEKIFRTKRIKAERFKELRRVNSWREAGRAACSPVWCQTPKHPALSSIFNWETAQADRISCWMCSSQVQFKWNRYEIRAVLLAGMAKKPPSVENRRQENWQNLKQSHKSSVPRSIPGSWSCVAWFETAEITAIALLTVHRLCFTDRVQEKPRKLSSLRPRARL